MLTMMGCRTQAFPTSRPGKRTLMSGTIATKTESGRPRPEATPARLRRRLERKLLAVGGSEVVWQGRDPHAALIAARGQLCTQRVRVRRGEPYRCHANAADRWATGTDRY